MSIIFVWHFMNFQQEKQIIETINEQFRQDIIVLFLIPLDQYH